MEKILKVGCWFALLFCIPLRAQDVCATNLGALAAEFGPTTIWRGRPSTLINPELVEAVITQLNGKDPAYYEQAGFLRRGDFPASNIYEVPSDVPGWFPAHPPKSLTGTPVEQLAKQIVPELDLVLDTILAKQTFPIRSIYFEIRRTSNTQGIRVRQGECGTDAEGFHTHKRFPLSMTWTLKGRGTTIKGHPPAETGELLIMGNDVPHGSPDSEEDRLMVLVAVEAK